MNFGSFLAAASAVVLVSCSDTSATDPLRDFPEDARKLVEAAQNDPVYAKQELVFWINGASAARLFTSIYAVPSSQRGVSLQFIEQKKKLRDEPSYYLEIEDLPANKVDAVVEKVAASWADGKLNFKADILINGNLKLHGHQKQLNTGGHIGFEMKSTAGIQGSVAAGGAADGVSAVAINLLPTDIGYTVGTSIKDKKEVCWRIEWPCVGTWSDPWRTCEGRDCKIAWDYDIPINVSGSERVPAQTRTVPITFGLNKSYKLSRTMGDKLVEKDINIAASPPQLTSDSTGFLISTELKIQ